MKVLKYTSNDDFEELVVEEKFLFIIPYFNTYRRKNGRILRYKEGGSYFVLGMIEGMTISQLFQHFEKPIKNNLQS